MQETLNTIIPVFLILFMAALAKILYFKYCRPISRRNQAVIGLSYAVLFLALFSCAFYGSRIMEPNQTMLFTGLSAIPAYLSWDYLRSSRPWRKQCS